MIIDFRSDTVTKPSKEMLEAMMQAQVGDDVFEDDPSINTLEQEAAHMFNKDAAIFCPSGTMTNQIAIRTHCKAGDEVLCDRNAHVYNFEGGGIAVNAQASVRIIEGDKGRISPAQVNSNINPDDIHYPISRLLCVENTINRAGGVYYKLDALKALSKCAKDNHLSYHMDGARFFNALIETEGDAKDYGPLFDSISICLSKGLGCPVGSLLIGDKAFIKQARRVRKLMGGGMRQGGFLAAAGSYALKNNIKRLKEDHIKAKQIEALLKAQSYISNIEEVFTNIVIFELKNDVNQSDFEAHLRNHNLKFAFIGPGRIRFVTHMDISDNMVEKVQKILTSFNP